MLNPPRGKKRKADDSNAEGKSFIKLPGSTVNYPNGLGFCFFVGGSRKIPKRPCFQCGRFNHEAKACPVADSKKAKVAKKQEKLAKCTKCKSQTHYAINCDEVKQWELNALERNLRNFGKLIFFLIIGCRCRT